MGQVSKIKPCQKTKGAVRLRKVNIPVQRWVTNELVKDVIQRNLLKDLRKAVFNQLKFPNVTNLLIPSNTAVN